MEGSLKYPGQVLHFLAWVKISLELISLGKFAFHGL